MAEGTEIASKYRGDCPKLQSISMLKSNASAISAASVCSDFAFALFFSVSLCLCGEHSL